jgi:pyruvate kinase
MEGTIDHKAEFAKRRFAHASDVNVTDTVIEAAVNASLELGAKALITPTESGFTARMAAKYRPQAPILAITLNDAVMKRLTMHHGVVPLKRGRVRSTDDMFAAALEHGRSTGLLAPGDFVVITAGIPSGRTGATNLIKIVQVED